jgi:hypothetical protein
MALLSRRDFFKTASLAAALPLGGIPAVAADAAAAAPATGERIDPSTAIVGWLEGRPALNSGTTFGVPWPRGLLPGDQGFAMSGEDGLVACQSWPIAFWPDGSLKWTAHAIAAGAKLSERFELKPGTPSETAGQHKVTVSERADAVVVGTGVIECTVPRTGGQIVSNISRNGRAILRTGTLVALSDDQPDASAGTVKQSRFTSDVTRVSVEQNGPVRSVVKVEGRHRGAGRDWLPFVVRLYFYAGAESVRVMHTFVFDGDEHKDFVRGIGLRFEVPMSDQLHDRHVRFAGEAGGLWAEGVRNLTGLRRDPGAAVRNAQVAGLPCPPVTASCTTRLSKNRSPVWAWRTAAPTRSTSAIPALPPTRRSGARTRRWHAVRGRSLGACRAAPSASSRCA